jgi:environmental stress-induced protein Ves
MIGHLTQADFKVAPWANGRGKTVEMFKVERDGAILWRLSRAAVVEDGPFSVLPGIDRTLTVVSGPGFDLVGDAHLHAAPLKPLAFSGDLALRAVGVQAPCEDVNVMVQRGAMRAEVAVMMGGEVSASMVALIALAPVKVGFLTAARFDLVLTDRPIRFEGQAIVVRLTEL